jgi:hypothetical protein
MLLEVAFARTPKEKRYVVVLVSSKYRCTIKIVTVT